MEIGFGPFVLSSRLAGWLACLLPASRASRPRLAAPEFGLRRERAQDRVLAAAGQPVSWPAPLAAAAP